MSRSIRKFLTIAFCALAVSLALCFAIMAWNEPGSAPPEGNISAPINTSSNPQTKAGDLTIGSGLTITSDGKSFALQANVAPYTGTKNLVIGQDGNVGIGTTAPGKKLDVAGKAQANELCLDGQCCSSWTDCAGLAGAYSMPLEKAIKIKADTSCPEDTYRVHPYYCCPDGDCPAFYYAASGSCSPPDSLPWQYYTGYCVKNGGNWFSTGLCGNTILVCRDRSWRVTAGQACNYFYPWCDKGYYMPTGCGSMSCSGDADCAGAPVGISYYGSQWNQATIYCSNGVCCPKNLCNVDGGCISEARDYDTVVVAKCENKGMRAVLGHSCEKYPCASGLECRGGVCTSTCGVADSKGVLQPAKDKCADYLGAYGFPSAWINRNLAVCEKGDDGIYRWALTECPNSCSTYRFDHCI